METIVRDTMCATNNGEAPTVKSPTLSDTLESMRECLLGVRELLYSIANVVDDENSPTPTETKEVHCLKDDARTSYEIAKNCLELARVIKGGLF